MARITVKACFCSIIILWNLTLSSQGSIVVAAHDLPISHNELTSNSEFEHFSSNDRSDLNWEKLIAPPCRIFDGSVISSQATVRTNDIATCPIESKAAQESSRSTPRKSDRDPLSQRAIWSAVSEFWTAQKSIVNRSLRSTEEAFADCHRAIGDFSVKSIESIAWMRIGKSSVESVKRLVPAVSVSHQQTVLEPNIDASIDLLGEQNETGSQSENESLISLPEPAQDSYWQYYEDCDRWGVDFAGLIMEAHDDLAIQTVDVETDVREESLGPVVSPPVFVARILASQNLSTWLYQSPLVEFQPSAFVSRWHELTQCMAIETAKTVLVQTDKNSPQIPDCSNNCQTPMLQVGWRQIGSLKTELINVLDRIFSLEYARNQIRSSVIKLVESGLSQ